MNEFLTQISEKRAEAVIKAMKRRNIEAIYFEKAADAVRHICGMIPPKSVVGLGGSVTIVESGLVEALRGLEISLLDRYKDGVTKEEIADMRVKGLMSDVFIASANALTADGRIVCMDGLGNRVASIIFGPKKVILMVGINKIVASFDEAVSRIRNQAAPPNSIRFGVDTPCSRTGFCNEKACTPPTRICSQLAMIESNAVDGRMNVVLVGETLGF